MHSEVGGKGGVYGDIWRRWGRRMDSQNLRGRREGSPGPAGRGMIESELRRVGRRAAGSAIVNGSGTRKGEMRG